MNSKMSPAGSVNRTASITSSRQGQLSPATVDPPVSGTVTQSGRGDSQ